MTTYFRKYLRDSVLIDLIRKAGFEDSKTVSINGEPPISVVSLAFCLIQGESAGDPYSTNYNGDSRPAQGWFPGGESHDCGLVQWNDYYWLSDPKSFMWTESGYPSKEEAYKLAYNPVWSVEMLAKFTNYGSKNWNTWLAITNGSYTQFYARAERARALAAPDPFWLITVGGKTPIRAKSVPYRCNPAISWSRWSNRNGIYQPEDLITPGTNIRVTTTTTKVQAGPVYPQF